jgi:uncharacterized protein YbaP (TraB family)
MPFMLDFLKKKILPLLLLPLAGCAGQEAPRSAAAAPKPAMWKLADADTTIYLFGTIHALPKDQQWRTPAFEQALSQADELVLEVANVDDAMAGAQAMMKLGMRKGLPPILERVPENKRGDLLAAMIASGVPVPMFDQLETWAAAMPLLALGFKDIGLEASEGVERQVMTPFKGAGKKVLGLETIEQQLGYLDSMPEEAQRTLLVGALENNADMKAQFGEMLAAWSSGDVKAIGRTFDSETQMSPELREALMTKRNTRWAEWLDKRMDRPGTVFVAVGAGHLAGKDSVREMLKKYGLKAERVQ